MSANPAVRIRYTNHRGETAWRLIRPIRTVFIATEWHGKKKQWFLEAWDRGKRAIRHFAVKDILEWKPVEKSK